MYPSGHWQGFWDQALFGRQMMPDLQLFFEAGKIHGRGCDIIGKFTFAGTYDSQGKIRMTKQYLGKHTVEYQGEYDGEGTIFGRWKIGEMTGTFAMSPPRPKRAEISLIQDLQ